MSSPFLAVDSWAVKDGKVRGLERHRERFITACAVASGSDAATTRQFFDGVVASLPRDSAWWPRVELGADGVLSSRLRPLPAPTGPLTAAVHLGDPRTVPRRKGPDLDLLGRIRAASGAGEVLLTDADGHLLDGTTTTPLWWEGDTLCHPDPALPILAGITAALILDRAAAQGIPIRPRSTQVVELVGDEVWLVNAVHGIRPVTAWSDGMPAGPAMRATEWQQWLEDQLEPLP